MTHGKKWYFFDIIKKAICVGVKYRCGITPLLIVCVKRGIKILFKMLNPVSKG